MTYGDKRIFPLLSLLFPFVDMRNQFHIDHIFPISRFSKIKLRQAGPAEWLRDRFKSDEGALNYQSIHALGQLPADIHGFEDFYATRRDALQDKLQEILVENSTAVDAEY
ncbi:hypothetical protein [Gluconobacter oxydans]|uniref:hypothetical protein n=1 Tax=Gluconobacter oxydans TaxID=442 RepID=UPI000A4A4D37|nr:hypothetical protein [Gluconobacter oxydans]